MRKKSNNKQGVALVISLAMLVLITILVVGLSVIVTTERTTARGTLDNQKGKAFAEMARDHAIAVLRDGIEAGQATGKFWSSQPGRITVFNADGTVDTSSSRDLSSGSDATKAEVDLNQATFGGNNPIASAASVGAATPPKMPVNWINVLADPKSAASAANQVVGRYAFWVDDESSKINVNTADGSSKYVAPDSSAAASSAPVSFGAGMPTEVNLQGLTGVTATLAQAISSLTGVRPGAKSTHLYNDAREILQVKDSGGAQPNYNDNNFSLTHYSRSPELNIFGEPKIYLMNAGCTKAIAGPLNLSIGDFAGYPLSYPLSGWANGLPIKQIYPSSNPFYINYPDVAAYGLEAFPNTSGNGNQLPNFKLNAAITPGASVTLDPNTPLPQYFPFLQSNRRDFHIPNSNGNPYVYALGLRIAQYLKGYNSQGNSITWPSFPGSTVSGFAGKYSDRQIDAITLQIIDLLSKDTFVEADGTHLNAYHAGYSTLSNPTQLPHGFLSPLPVKGIGRMPRLNQVLMTFSVTPGNPPLLSITTNMQWYLPKEFKGVSFGDEVISYLQHSNQDGYINNQDLPQYDPGLQTPTGPSLLGGTEPWWAHQMLKITGQDGKDAGVDLFGNCPDVPDPDQASAQLFHPKSLYHVSPTNSAYNPAYAGKYMGTGPISDGKFHIALVASSVDPITLTDWPLGYYRATKNYYAFGNAYEMRSVDTSNPSPPLPPLTSIKITGGIAVWVQYQGAVEVCPLDSMRGPGGGTGSPTDANVLVGTGENFSDPKVKAAVLAAVIPMPPGGLTLDFSDGNGVVGQVLMKVPDPMVNNMPGDWISIANPSASDITLTPPTPAQRASQYPNGANQEFLAAGGGDPSAYWLPEINLNIPKSQRFPSSGYLQYVRTGTMPDPANEPSDARYVPGSVPKGTPFRLLSLAPSTSPGQATAGGGSYPDWAMLDLFTSPVSPQPLGSPLPSYLEMTSGGSTPGRVNPNSPSALFPFDSTVTRLNPLEAVFKNIQVSNSYSSTSANTPENPVFSTVDEQALASAIAAYLATLKDTNGNSRPFLVPGEVANVPAVANYLYKPSVTLTQSYESRNDLVRQVIGNLTTQSNTFSIWAVGQGIKKIHGNTSYGNVETGDVALGETRTHYNVERYIDLGTDGVPGNAKAGDAGNDGIIGTPDDVVSGDDTVSPNVPGPNPKMSYPLPYKYRVVAAEEIVN